MPLDSKCQSGAVAWLPPLARALLISIETDSGFIADHTPPVGHTPACPGRTSYASDTTGCLEGGKWHRTDSRDVVGEEGVALIIVQAIIPRICIPGTSWPSAEVEYSFRDPLLPTLNNYHIARTEVAVDTAVGPTCSSEAYNTHLPKSDSCLYHRRLRMNQTCFQNVEEWSETNITGNNSFQWYFLTWSQVKRADVENYVEFLSKEMPDIKIDNNCLFEAERRLNVYLNSNKFEQLENQHV
ncbi:hypothetical protein TNCV_815671 [Trichonephila clavipes]|nr:hypothetical protein TNCV_815671 [Trichonephila clavipes]